MESGFRHEALIYEDGDELLSGAVPFLRAGLEAGEPAIVALGDQRASLLRGELGADAGEVRFIAIEELGRNPARLIPFWLDYLEDLGAGPARGLGEPVWPGRGAAEIDECHRHESLINLAFARHTGLSLLCAYDSSALPEEALHEVSSSHHVVALDGAAAPPNGNGDHRAARDCFAGSLPAHPGDATIFDFDRDGLGEVRRRVERVARAAGLSRPATVNLVVAASELAANSVAHGGGAGTLRAWREDGRLVVECEDGGRIEEPLAGRLRPSPTQEGGRGLWLANQLCDLVQIRSGELGTTVRLQAALD